MTKWLRLLAALVIVLVLDFPLLFLLMTSFKSDVDISAGQFRWAFRPVLDNYRHIFANPAFPLWHYLGNSFVVASGSVALTLALSIPAAYSMARLRVGGAGLSSWFLSFRILPPIVFALPMFLLVRFYGLADSVWSLLIAYLPANIPFAIWVLRSFVRELPVDIEEAAAVDGASPARVLVSIVLPLLRPGIVAVGILTFIFSWNEFLYALMLTLQRGATMTVGTARFVTGYSILWGPISAAAVVAAIPMLTLGFLVQRFLVRGLTLGAVKG